MIIILVVLEEKSGESGILSELAEHGFPLLDRLSALRECESLVEVLQEHRIVEHR